MSSEWISPPGEEGESVEQIIYIHMCMHELWLFSVPQSTVCVVIAPAGSRYVSAGLCCSPAVRQPVSAGPGSEPADCHTDSPAASAGPAKPGALPPVLHSGEDRKGEERREDKLNNRYVYY